MGKKRSFTKAIANASHSTNIYDNSKIVTIQRGRPYFFPNCKNDNFLNQNILDCTLITKDIISSKKQLIYKYPINSTYYDITKKLSSISL